MDVAVKCLTGRLGGVGCGEVASKEAGLWRWQ